MKHTLFCILSLSGLWVACNNNSQTSTQTGENQHLDTSAAAASDAASSCYRYISGKDSVMMQLTIAGNTVSGELVYSFFEKDNNTGTIQGRLIGDTIFADYTFLSEGTISVREIAMLRKENTLTEGYGAVRQMNNKMVFADRRALNFKGNPVLTKTDCMSDEHGCVASVGYWWSTLKNSCIKPVVSGIRLNRVDDATINTKPAFILFSENKNQVELFLPGKQMALLMERKGEEGSHYWENQDLKLYPWKGYVLKQNDKTLYAGQ